MPQSRACFRSGEIRVLDSTGNVERIIPFDETNRNLWRPRIGEQDSVVKTKSTQPMWVCPGG